MGETDVGLDRKREIRFLISRLYRVGARDAEGRHRLSGDAFQQFVAAAKEHIRPEHSAIFEFTARAVRAGFLDRHTAATRLAAYYAPGTTGEKIVDFILDFTPARDRSKLSRNSSKQFRTRSMLGNMTTRRLSTLRSAEQPALRLRSPFPVLWQALRASSERKLITL
jgi:hypothetical protein